MLAMKTWYPSKAAWAAAKARELRQEARLMPTVQSADWQGVRRRMRALRALRAEADRMDRLAKVFSERGE